MEAAARLLALAFHFESLDWDGEEAKLLDAAAPTAVTREFPGLGARQLIAQWERGETEIPLSSFTRVVIANEVRAALDAELDTL